MSSMRFALAVLSAVAAVAMLAACGDDSETPATPAADTPAGSSPTTAAPATPSPSATSTATPVTDTATPEPTPTEPPPTPTVDPGPAIEPRGFPLDPATVLGVVVGESPDRTIDWTGGGTALVYARDYQPSGDNDAANRSGWNCRVHFEFEGNAAVDWYIQPGTPLLATMDGTATLYVITTSNAFDYYGTDREPYIGNPDRSRAPLSPFPGPGGGKGVFVEVTNGSYTTEYAHMEMPGTLAAVPGGAYLPGYSAGTDYLGLFGKMRGFQDVTPIASWEVRRGDVIGYSGDSGYSEAAHLHYTIRRPGGPLLCPTTEAAFGDGGWLFR